MGNCNAECTQRGSSANQEIYIQNPDSDDEQDILQLVEGQGHALIETNLQKHDMQ